jgi:threonine dehydrogenase-like Zn-dependent dehydrogenase
MSDLPQTHAAIQLVGPGQVVLNPTKPTPRPNPHQLVVKVEAVGLCFSDMKLLKQFSEHARKTPILRGIDSAILEEIPSYVPRDKPTVPGHEVTCRVVAVGDQVKHYKVGERYIVQADYRVLKTLNSNASFGYAFEGGLQEYVLLDERIIGDPQAKDGYMILADEENSASALALVEPWACVERAYATAERRYLTPHGKLLVVAEPGISWRGLESCLSIEGAPRTVMAKLSDSPQEAGMSAFSKWTRVNDLNTIEDSSIDDIIYFGADPDTIELLNNKIAVNGIINIALCGRQLGRKVSMGIGRVHYGNVRWVGTTGSDASKGYKMIPKTGEIREGDKVLVVGAGGPMGQMHVIRSLSLRAAGVTVVGADLDDGRLEALAPKVAQFEGYRAMNTSREDPGTGYSYVAIMAPIPALVVDAIERCSDDAIINVFAGIPAPVKHEMDLQKVIEKRAYMIGTSGSEVTDMKVVYRKLLAGELDTNLSVGAVSGMAGAKDGLEAVEKRTLDGKILVYPELQAEGLIPLPQLASLYPSVSAKLNQGSWTKEAEAEFLKVGKRN